MIKLTEAWERIKYDNHAHLRAHMEWGQEPNAYNLSPMRIAAEKCGLKLYAREHAPMPPSLRLGPNKDYGVNMGPHEIDAYLDQYKNSPWPVGFEMDYITCLENEVRETVNDLLRRTKKCGIPVSAVAGSIHLLPGMVEDIPVKEKPIAITAIDYTADILKKLLREQSPRKLLDSYFDTMAALVQSGIFQVISHLDLLRKFDAGQGYWESVYFAGLEKYYHERSRGIVDLAARHNVVIELNTSGFNYPYGRPYLSQELLQYCREKNVGVQVSSDAHYPEQVGQFFDVAYEMLKQAGITEMVIFENQQPVIIPLP
ncbi:hypothetical protein KAH55_03335 [bacterium]|nr:hypothetical protein [bacterium]